ncbi:hypothetical protein [Sphingobacterium chuzhouense]|uniref:Uncharacterized protein n=1 Tax=Sphingobacterium chuzhouense TaxID=1742264 RepID=A0ABR7XXF0_9SPHI|nr:hypothetical protein [Sphingobacterium chuzhouense]MBD1423744.1 hypothetical protein [Sphingobacterium chuzhouense]
MFGRPSGAVRTSFGAASGPPRTSFAFCSGVVRVIAEQHPNNTRSRLEEIPSMCRVDPEGDQSGFRTLLEQETPEIDAFAIPNYPVLSHIVPLIF